MIFHFGNYKTHDLFFRKMYYYKHYQNNRHYEKTMLCYAMKTCYVKSKKKQEIVLIWVSTDKNTDAQECYVAYIIIDSLPSEVYKTNSFNT